MPPLTIDIVVALGLLYQTALAGGQVVLDSGSLGSDRVEVETG